MVIYNNKMVNPVKNGKIAQFIYHNGNIVSGFYDNLNEILGKKPFVVENYNEYYLQYNNGTKYSSYAGDYDDVSLETLKDPSTYAYGYFLKEDGSQTVWMPVYYGKESGFRYVPTFLGNANKSFVVDSSSPLYLYPTYVFKNSYIGAYKFGKVQHSQTTNLTLNNTNVGYVYYQGYDQDVTKNIQDIEVMNYSGLAENTKISSFYDYENSYSNYIWREFGLKGCNIGAISIEEPHTSAMANMRTVIHRFQMPNSTVDTIRFNFGARTAYYENTSFRNGIYELRFAGNFKLDRFVVNNTSTNWWNRPLMYFNGYDANIAFSNGFSGNLIHIFHNGTGMYNSNITNREYGITLFFNSNGKAVNSESEKNWTFYQPKATFKNFVLYLNSYRTEGLDFIPNINIQGWTDTENVAGRVNLNGVSCSNFICNFMTSGENVYLSRRTVNISNSYIGYTVAGYCFRAQDVVPYGNIYHSDGSYINNSILASSVSGTVTEFVHNDGSSLVALWNTNMECMNNVYITGLNTQIRLNAFMNNSNSSGNGIKFNAGNFFVRNLNLYFATYMPSAGVASKRTTPANVRFEFRTHWGGYWNAAYPNAMPVWNNMNGMLRYAFSSLSMLNGKVTIDISPQYYTLTSDFGNHKVLKNMFFGNSVSANYNYTNANYGWINISSYMWGQPWGINVLIRRVSACNFANNRYYANIYINTI